MHRIYASILYIMYIHVKNFSSLNTQILTVESITPKKFPVSTVTFGLIQFVSGGYDLHAGRNIFRNGNAQGFKKNFCVFIGDGERSGSWVCL